MKLYQNLNNYLLRNYPNIWITRIHLFVPIGLAIFFLIFGLNALSGYDLKSPIPNGESSIFLMIIPVLIYVVYWFVFQARYNVEKSGGKLTLFQDYINYFSYFLIFLISFMIIMVIPFSNNYKVAHSVTKTEFEKDIEVLNSGHSIFNEVNSDSIYNGDYVYYRTNEYGNYRTDNSDRYFTVKSADLASVAKNYKTTYNKYADEYSGIDETINELILFALTSEHLSSPYNGWRSSVSYKIDSINEMHKNGWYDEFLVVEAFMILGGFLAMFALLIWIFKQIFWKYYVFGLVTMFLTPLFIAIVGLLFFEMFNFDEEFAFILVFITYLIFIIKVIIGVNSPQRNNSAIVMAMYLQLALPFLPILIIASSNSNFRYIEDNIGFVYIISWVVGLLSIAVFKYVYKHLSILPSKK
jgi:hypothetical protein